MDQAAVAGRGLPLELMLEHAGRAMADLLDAVSSKPIRTIRVLCGHGGNGAGGLTAARHLLQRGHEVVVYHAASSSRTSSEWRDSLRRFLRFEGKIGAHPRPEAGDVVVDAMLGYSQRGPPRHPFDAWIRAANETGALRIASDVPTGVDPATGAPSEVAFRADHTLMLGVGKAGLRRTVARSHAGQLWLADVGFPPSLGARLRPPAWVFARAGGRAIRIPLAVHGGQ
ncbi:MAG: NAD(P)H-hydrate epimerase [Euryarchaeota archaeon]|nr:NAD(P)H-hydrate epimerase [Euryarchaeota archaeon]